MAAMTGGERKWAGMVRSDVLCGEPAPLQKARMMRSVVGLLDWKSSAMPQIGGHHDQVCRIVIAAYIMVPEEGERREPASVGAVRPAAGASS